LVEQLVILTIMGLLTAITTVGGAHLLDDAAVHAAARDVRDALATAREYAVATGVRTAVEVETTPARVVVHAAADTVLARPLFELHGVLIEGTRDSMAYAPSGLGYGAANLRVVVRRHGSADTINVSRLGRVR
jgi:hypothetical protein